MPSDLAPTKLAKKNSLPLEELTADSQGSGIEAEPEEEEEIRAPFDPTLIDVITHQRTIDLLMSRLDHGEINLSPDFQRRANLWRDPRKTGLIESILLRIPIPSLYVSEDKEGNYEVVDGLQRLCAIAHFVKVDSLNKALKTQLDPLRLTGLHSLKNELDGRTFEELSRALQRRIRETELTLHVIRAGTPQNVKFNIFSRINQGGLPLRAQEIRNAIYPGLWRDRVRAMASCEEFQTATEGKIRGERLEDHELVLRFVATYSLGRRKKRDPVENLDDFLNNFVEKQAPNLTPQKWADLERAFRRALEAAPRVFKHLAFRKFSAAGASRHPINRGLFETEIVALAALTPVQIEKLAKHSNKVIAKFGKKFENDDVFVSALLYATGRGSSSNARLDAINEIFREVLNA